MSEFKGTPGPWSHGLDLDPPDCGIDGPGGGCVCHVQVHGNVNTVARTGEEFSHADARLIAAAPDLLEACEAFRSQYEYFVSLWGQEGVTRGVADKVFAAISKAKGGA